jgi:hypothetical protein
MTIYALAMIGHISSLPLCIRSQTIDSINLLAHSCRLTMLGLWSHLESYSNVIMRASGISSGRRSLSHITEVPSALCLVHVHLYVDARPWTAITLGEYVSSYFPNTLTNLLYRGYGQDILQICQVSSVSPGPPSRRDIFLFQRIGHS